jgi:hypothetical protein
MAMSLRRVCPSLRLHVVCLDDATTGYLRERAGIVTIPLAELERVDSAVAATRSSRSRKTYAWTLKPACCVHVLRTRSDAEAVAFVDADLLFFSSPDPIFAELARASVLLVPERPEPPSAWTDAGVRPELGTTRGATKGFYNSGLVAFRRDVDGLAALHWWRQRCVESCEPGSVAGQHGDQWHLNEVPALFAGVRVIEHPGVGLAPWNAHAAKLGLRRGQLLADGHPG